MGSLGSLRIGESWESEALSVFLPLSFFLTFSRFFWFVYEEKEMVGTDWKSFKRLSPPDVVLSIHVGLFLLLLLLLLPNLNIYDALSMGSVNQ